MSRNRASQAELIVRRQEIQELIVQGHNNQFIVDRMAEKWKTSKRAIQEDIKIIGKEWQLRAEENMQLMRNKYEDRLEWLFCEAAGKGHIKVALEVQKEIQKLNNVNEKKEEDKDQAPQFINISKKGALKVVGESDDTEH